MKELFVYIRSLEIVIAILMGTLLCWFGYRLFYHGLSGKSELTVEYGKIKFYLFSAAPGIFFSLFGALVILLSLWMSGKLEQEQTLPDGTRTRTVIEKDVNPVISDKSKLEKIQQQFEEAVLLHHRGRLQESRKIYEEILKSLPIMGQASNNLADIYLSEGDLENARVYANYSVAIFPDSVTFENTLSTIQKRLSSHK